MEKLFVIGYGPGDESMLPDIAKDLIEASGRVLNTREVSLTELFSELKKPTAGGTAVLVSGDSGCFSIAKKITEEFSGLYEIELVPGIGSVQYLSAKIQAPYDDAALVSLHGRKVNIVAKVAYNYKVFALTGGENRVPDICRTLSKYGLGGVLVSVGERLSYPDERIVTDRAEALTGMDFDEMSIMYIDNPSAVDPHIPLKDSDFIRSDVPMTKEEIRWLSIGKLGVMPQDIAFDIGAGTGSVAVEMARKAYEGFVYAIETRDDACELVRQNAARHGTFNLEIVNGEAPGAFEGLPVPDKAFIGGSSGNMDGILKGLLSLNPDIKIVANAITLRTLGQIREGFEKHGIESIDTICVNIAKVKSAGEYDMMTAQNPVYIVTGIGGGNA